MLHIQVHLVPFGVDEARTTLTDVYVGNDGTGNREVANYDVYDEDPRGKSYPREQRSGHIGRIENFPRSAGRDALAAAALDLAGNNPGRA